MTAVEAIDYRTLDIQKTSTSGRFARRADPNRAALTIVSPDDSRFLHFARGEGARQPGRANVLRGLGSTRRWVGLVKTASLEDGRFVHGDLPLGAVALPLSSVRPDALQFRLRHGVQGRDHRRRDAARCVSARRRQVPLVVVGR